MQKAHLHLLKNLENGNARAESRLEDKLQERMQFAFAALEQQVKASMEQRLQDLQAATYRSMDNDATAVEAKDAAILGDVRKRLDLLETKLEVAEAAKSEEPENDPDGMTSLHEATDSDQQHIC
eukprot:scaffold505135_cov19-Prasinocladus_malaysianus.AAC.1